MVPESARRGAGVVLYAGNVGHHRLHAGRPYNALQVYPVLDINCPVDNAFREESRVISTHSLALDALHVPRIQRTEWSDNSLFAIPKDALQSLRTGKFGLQV